MKYLALIFTLISSIVSAHEIQGTPMRKGTIKTDITVDRVKSTCKVKVLKISNLNYEDSFGNPAYNAKLEISVNGFDFINSRSVSFEHTYNLKNMFTENDLSIVKDYEYESKSENVSATIDEDGYLIQVKFIYKNNFREQTLTCIFKD